MVATPAFPPLLAIEATFSPLFIGAMVATENEVSSSTSQWTFSPLFIGAMVATADSVSACRVGRAFSPLFIGAMVATITAILLQLIFCSFSPLFIGAMVATLSERLYSLLSPTFSPLFIGAMVATDQSSIAVSGLMLFQSPFHRGNGCYFTLEQRLRCSCYLSVPFSSGQWLLLKPITRLPFTKGTFSPLFIGAMVATDLLISSGAMVATDLLISSRNGSKRSRILRLYIIRVILTHRRCPVNFKRSGRHIFSVHQCLRGLRVEIRKSLVCSRTSLGAHGTST